MLSIEKAMERSQMGYARHKVVYDESGKPVDYVFLSLNPAFERLTGTKKEDILNRRIREVMPKITQGDFDWIGYYGKIANIGQSKVFEQYSYPLDKWYRVEAFSCEQGYFTTLFTDITHERELAEASKDFLNDGQKANTYEQITQRMKRITGADYVALNVFLEDGEHFQTVAIAGVPGTLQKAVHLLGFNPEKKEWAPDPYRFELIKDNRVTTFAHLHELTGQVLSKKAIQLLEKTFHLGQTVIVKSTRGERIIGDFTLMFTNGKELQNENEAIIYADMLGMLIENRNQQRKLEENEDRFNRAIEGTGAGLWDWDMVKDHVFFSKRWKSMLGYEDHEIKNDFSGWKSLWHPDDAPRIEKAINDYLEGRTKTYLIEHRLRHKDGSWHWISTRGDIEKDASGKPIRWTGTNIDITEQKQQQEELARQKEALENNRNLINSIIKALPGFLLVVDKNHNILLANESRLKVGKVKHQSLEQVVCKKCYEMFMDRDTQCPWCKLDDVIETGESFSETTTPEDPREQITGHALSLLSSPVRNKQGEVIGVVEYGIDVTELRNAKIEAQEANKAKSKFLSTMNHELRTPLSGIIGYSDILRNMPLDEEQKEYLEIIYTSGKHLADIISDILDFSRIEAGKFELNPEKTELKALIENTLSIVRPKAKEKGLYLSAFIENAVPQNVEVDGSRLRQILINLIANAIKFTDEGSVIVSVSLRERDSDKVRLLFKVTDTGMGIKQEEQTIIFEPFQQADMSPDKKDQGTGLGLAITKKILELMGGTLALESEYGKGSTFYFELLLPCEQEQPEDSEEANPENIEEQTVFTNKKILIAEDNPINMHYVQAAINMFSKDIHVIKAKDGKEAYHLYREHNPDLIIMDIRMPHVDGYHATAKIRAQDKQVPIIAMTAKALIEDKEKCLAAGMNDFLSKPVSLDQLKETVEKYLVRR